MSDHKKMFWESFNAKDFKSAWKHFEQLDGKEKSIIFEVLYQKSETNRTPLMLSVLRRELHDNNSFSDFYQSWFPSDEMCNPVEVGGQVYQQHFPVPVRVINATNVGNPKEVISIGITWVSSKEEEAELWKYIDEAKQGDNENNGVRHEEISKVADGELLGIFRVETDDNLGSPF